MASHAGVAPVAAEACQPRDDEPRVTREQACGREVEAFEHAGAEGIEEDVGAGEEREEERAAAGRFEVEGEGGLVRGEEVGR